MTQTVTLDLKACCAALYERDWVPLLLGHSWHPGGLTLTTRLGELLGLDRDSRMLDVAAGTGTSALWLAQRFACRVVGVDYSERNVAVAQEAAAAAGIADRVRFVRGDGERLPFGDGTFDAVLCECAFCTFRDKAAAAGELARMLRPGGRVSLSDLTRAGPLPPDLDGLLAWVTCIADALPLSGYAAFLEKAGLAVDVVEPHDEALGELVREIRAKLLGAELLVHLQQLDLPGVDLEQAKALARCAAEAVKTGTLGYGLVVGRKRSASGPCEM